MTRSPPSSKGTPGSGPGGRWFGSTRHQTIHSSDFRAAVRHGLGSFGRFRARRVALYRGANEIFVLPTDTFLLSLTFRFAFETFGTLEVARRARDGR